MLKTAVEEAIEMPANAAVVPVPEGPPLTLIAVMVLPCRLEAVVLAEAE